MNIELNKTHVKVKGNKLVIELTEDIKKKFGIACRGLWECNIGDIVIDNLGNEWYVIEQDIENWETKLWRKELLDETHIFDEKTNNFSKSEIKEWLNDENGKILKDIYKGFGKRNILEDIVDLTSLNGLDGYGTCKCKVHLGTLDNYRAARKNGMFRQENKDLFWLDTPDSADEYEGVLYQLFIMNEGGVAMMDPDCAYSVRPFISLRAATHVTTKE